MKKVLSENLQADRVEIGRLQLVKASENSVACAAGRDAKVYNNCTFYMFGVRMTSKEQKLFRIIRAMDNPSAFLDRTIQKGLKQLEAE